MAEKSLGIAVTAQNSSAALATIEDLEKRGFLSLLHPMWTVTSRSLLGEHVKISA